MTRDELRQRYWPLVRDLCYNCGPYNTDEVLALLIKHEVTAEGFTELDEHPGIWGYNPFDDENEWHHKLRWSRNNGDLIKRYNLHLKETT